LPAAPRPHQHALFDSVRQQPTRRATSQGRGGEEVPRRLEKEGRRDAAANVAAAAAGKLMMARAG